jgi:uncharacterized protein YydD (DUF2326 family)
MTTIKSEQKKDDNIFDLTKLADIERDHEIQKASSTINIEDQNKLLQGFVELLRDDWDKLSFNDYIRYLRNDGSFRRGGYFRNSWIGSYGKNKGKKCIQISATKSFKSSTWSICLGDIDKIWKCGENISGGGGGTPNEKKIDSILQKKINTQEETIQYLSKSVEQLKIDLLKMNNEQKRVINLIKKLHGIKSNQ